MSTAINPLSDHLLRAGVRRDLDAPRWAVYYQGEGLVIVNVPHRVALQIAKQVSHATVITMEAAARISHQHQLGATVCAQCAGKRREVVTI